MTNLTQMSVFKKKFDTQIICVGDVVEWRDFTGEIYQAAVNAISYVDRDYKSCVIHEFPLWEKDEYSVELELGMWVAGSAVVRKVAFRRDLDKSKNFRDSAEGLSGVFN